VGSNSLDVYDLFAIVDEGCDAVFVAANIEDRQVANERG